MEHIPNFETLAQLFKKWLAASDEDADWLIREMQELDGYSEWLEWMEENQPEDFP